MRQNNSILASRFMESGQWERALGAARDWLADEPASAPAHLAAARSLIVLGRGAEAEPHLVRALAAEPENDAHRMMSTIHSEQGRVEEAERSAARAIALNPVDPFHWYQMAHLCCLQEDSARALKCATRARQSI